MAIPFVLWLVTLIGLAVANCPAAKTPLSVPITDVLLSNGNQRRGILGSVGTPAQNMSFMINPWLNDTWIYNATTPLCSNGTAAQECLTLRGGLYNTQSSTSFKGQPDVNAAGGDPNDTARMYGEHIWLSTWATDTLTIGKNSLQNYPIGMPGFDYGGTADMQEELGLGRNSTLLQRLKSEGLISSRSWSYWWGIDNPNSTSMDGQLVLGGYDAAKVVGTPITNQLQYSSYCESGMIINLTNMQLGFPNGTSVDWTNVVTACCIEPDYPVVTTIHQSFFESFQNITGTQTEILPQGDFYGNPQYYPDNVYHGNLQLQVAGGPTINISNDVLVVPEQYVTSSGSVVVNASAAVLNILPDGTGDHANDVPLLGTGFLSGAYISVNHENGTWSLWAANPTTETNLIPIADETCTHSSTPSPQPSTSTGLSSGAIAGIAVGCVCAGLIALGLVVFLVWAKKRRARRDTTLTKDGSIVKDPGWDVSKSSQAPDQPSPTLVEAPVEGRQRAELPAGRERAELPANSKPLEMSEVIPEDQDPVELPAS